MSKFKFRYEKLLNLLESQEKDVKNKLNKAQMSLKEEEEIRESLVKRNHGYNNLLKTELNDGCTLNFIKNINNYKRDLNNIINEQNNKIVLLEDNIKNIRNELVDVLKEKKIMEKLREKKKLEHDNTLLSIEERMIDELVTYKNSETCR